MVIHFTMRTYGVDQAFRFVEGFWSHRRSCQIRFFLLGNELSHFIRAQHVLSYPSYIRTMILPLLVIKMVSHLGLRADGI